MCMFSSNQQSISSVIYDYLHFEQEKKKKLANNCGPNPFDGNDKEEIERIAAELERKYGNAYTGSGIGVRSMHNAYDKGSGYDENDGFIDNSEAVCMIV